MIAASNYFEEGTKDSNGNKSRGTNYTKEKIEEIQDMLLEISEEREESHEQTNSVGNSKR